MYFYHNCTTYAYTTHNTLHVAVNAECTSTDFISQIDNPCLTFTQSKKEIRTSKEGILRKRFLASQILFPQFSQCCVLFWWGIKRRFAAELNGRWCGRLHNILYEIKANGKKSQINWTKTVTKIWQYRFI